MDRKIIALLGLMLVADLDAKTILLHLLKKRSKELKGKGNINKKNIINYNSGCALSQVISNNSDSSEDNTESSDEEEISSDDNVTSDEDDESPKIVHTEKVMIKSEPHDDGFELSDEVNQNYEDSDEDLFGESDFVTHSEDKSIIKEEPKDAEDSTVDVKIESEEMIIDDILSNKLLSERGINSDIHDTVQSAGTSEDQNAGLGSLVTLSLNSLKHKQSREKLERLIQRAIKDVTEEDTSQCIT